jgi:hypothetical protein
VGRGKRVHTFCWNVNGRISFSSAHIWRGMSRKFSPYEVPFDKTTQLYFWTYSLSSPRWRNVLCWLVGCTPLVVPVKAISADYNFADANTIGSIAAVASIDWGCAIQVMAAASIGSGGTFEATAAQTLYVILYSFY